MVALIVIRTATDWLTIAASASGGRLAGSSHRTEFIVARHSAGLWVPIFDRTKSICEFRPYEGVHIYLYTQVAKKQTFDQKIKIFLIKDRLFDSRKCAMRALAN